MDPAIVGVIGIVILFVILLLGMPVGFSMALVGFAGFWYLTSDVAAFAKIAVSPFGTISEYSFAVLPLFILMAQIVFITDLGKDLYDLAAKWFGRLPGGLAIATIAGCAGFAAVSATSAGSTATMGLTAIPEMKRFKYSKSLAAGCVAAGGTIGSLIPPSGMLIIYGILTETSINKLFIGGVVPGILEALFYVFIILVLCIRNPALGPRGDKTSFKEKILAFKNCGEIFALVILVVGGLMIGWFTPTEAGAVGAFGAVVFSMIRRRLTWQKFKTALIDSLEVSGIIYTIMIGAFLLTYFIAVSELPFQLADVVENLEMPPIFVMAFIIMIYLILGCFVDAAAMIMLTIPIFFPLATSIGYSAIWFGIIVIRVTEVAVITPPIGINVWTLHAVAPDVPMVDIYKGVLPFIAMDVLHISMLLAFPAIVTFLPNLLM